VCGISGFWNISRSYSYDQMMEMIENMTQVLYHRGPDSSGVWINPDDGVALGHRRLSILDLSPLGHQPMRSEDQRYMLIFNGEIYNFKKLTAELIKLGCKFRGTSDTEVMLAAFSKWGIESAVQKFTGMFAFVLWDKQKKILSLGRDRIGEKPLYYGIVSNTFVFASELKSFKACEHWEGKIDRNALGLFFKYNYIPTPHTIYENIFKLLPGTILTINQDNIHSSLSPKPYWSLSSVVKSSVEKSFVGSEDAVVNQLEELLKDKISQQMISDVSIGAFLSGGVDSSTVVALMQSISNQPIKTFTIGFTEEFYNEAPYAASVAKHLKTNHTELYVTPKEINDVIPKLPCIYDEPFGDSSQIPTILVSQLAKSQVTVSLSGDAGDEVFGGYNRYFLGEKFQSQILSIPLPLRKLARNAISSLSPQQWDSLVKNLGINYPIPGDRLYKLASILDCPDEWSFYNQLTSCWQDHQNPVIGTTIFPHPLLNGVSENSSHDFVSAMMIADTLTYLPDDILVKVDRASMSAGLESRIPFLDQRVIEFAWSLPLSMKLRDKQTKWILRQVLYKYVPKELIERPKQGFGIPIDRLLRTTLRDWAESLLNRDRIESDGYLNYPLIHQKWEEHQSGTKNWQHQLWTVLMFQSWLKENI
jgi:asparagine synthase (glutamine-hydrolysing)